MLKNNYYYNDDFMFFTFDNIHSSKFNLFITNDGELEWPVSTGASIEVEAPMYQDIAYYLGITKNKKEFNLPVAANNLSIEDIKEMLLWLEEGKTGLLFFDWNIDWGLEVVINRISNPKVSHNNQNIIEFEISFSTIGDYNARSPWTINAYIDETFNNEKRESTIANQYGIPEIDCTKNEENKTINVKLPVIGNKYSFIDYSFAIDGYQSNALFELGKNYINSNNEIAQEQPIISYTLNNEYNNMYYYYGRSNYLLQNNKYIVELVDGLVQSTKPQNSNILKLNGLSPKKFFVLKTEYINNTLKLFLPLDQIDKLQYLNNFYISVAFIQDNNYAIFNKKENWNESKYPILYKNLIVYFKDFEEFINTTELKQDCRVVTFNNVDSIWSQVNEHYLLIYYGNYNEIYINHNNGINSNFLTVYKYNNL